MRRIISAPLLALFLTAGLIQVPAQAAAPLELAANAPERHVVVPGDTLWGISGKFLKSPWRWPELWRMNKSEVRNPHLIYPGQVLVLEYDADGRPRLRVEGAGEVRDVRLEPKIYVEPQKKAISSIPYELIQPYLARPMVMDLDKLDDLPRIASAENDRIILGAGDKVFVTGIKGRDKLLWHIYRPGALLRDPDSGEKLGHEAVYVGSARLIAEGEPATLQVTRSTLEIARGDRLIAEREPEIMSYMPRPPEQDIRGRILTLYGAAGNAGRYEVVSFSRGAKDGVEAGHVMALSRASRAVDERFNGVKRTHINPEQQTGQAFVFLVFDRVSYALIMSSDDPITKGDVVRTP